MLSKKVIDYLKNQQYYLEEEEKSYKESLLKIGISLNTDFAFFNLHTTEMSFKGKSNSFIDNICWFIINSTYLRRAEALQDNLNLSKVYIPLDRFEGEGGFFYNIETEEVIKLELGKKLTNFQNGIIDTKWDNFNDFLEYFFELN